jgi:phasin family protein
MATERTMASTKTKNGRKPTKASSSPVASGFSPENEPTTRDDSKNLRNGENYMDGAQGTTFDTKTTIDSLTKTTEKITSFGQGNVEAIVKSSQVWAAGCQAISKTMAATAQANLDQTMSTWKAMLSIKSLKEAMDLRTSLTHASIETVFAETSKLTNASMKLAEETIAPITERITLAAEKFKNPALWLENSPATRS